MKIISILVLIIFLSSFKHNDVTKEVIDKSHKIRKELLTNKALPRAIQKPNFGSDVSPTQEYQFFYNIKRKENNILVSVMMIAFVYKDSLEHLAFQEVHFKGDIKARSYMYQVNKYGVIDWAYRTEAPKSDSQIVEDDPMIPIIEINTNPTNSIDPVIKPDEKTRAAYTARLTASLNELYKILFAK